MRAETCGRKIGIAMAVCFGFMGRINYGERGDCSGDRYYERAYIEIY